MDDAPKSGKPPDLPAALRALMVEVGPRWGKDVPGHVELMLCEFSDILKEAPRGGVSVRRDIAYGSHSRQMIDLFLPSKQSGPLPVLLFVHGGAFVDGHRNRTEEIYANVLYYFARNGIAGVNIGYRLAGDAQYPGATEDVASVVAWVTQHASELGVDAGRIFLMGHSAGCAHAASYAYDARRRPDRGHSLRGLIIVSGRVRADVSPENPNARKVAAYYGATDAAELDRMSPVSHVGSDSVATLVAWAEYENPLIDIYCAELVYRLALAKRRAPPVVWLAGHNHTSMIAHFNTSEDALGRAILRFIAQPS